MSPGKLSAATLLHRPAPGCSQRKSDLDCSNATKASGGQALPRRVILIGMKSCGKTTVGRLLARRLGVPFIDMDTQIEQLHHQQTGEKLPFREIFKRYGRDYFRRLETAALQQVADSHGSDSFVLATGGGLPMEEQNRQILRRLGTVVFLDVRQDVLLARIVARGIPAFFPYPDDPRRSLAELLDARRPVYRALATVTIECRGESPSAVVRKILRQLQQHACEH
jgi:shikimate kinase